MSRLWQVASALAVAGSMVAGNAQAVQRTFVASYGSDANTAANCTFSNPCRSFTAALGVTDSGGEIIAIDAAGYGAVNINKSVSIIANPGVYAGISAATGNAVTIATPGVNVVLRGLNINGTGASIGVDMFDGVSLAIEACVISNFGQYGVQINAPVNVRISDTVVRGNGTDGIWIAQATIDIFRVKSTGNAQSAVFVQAGPVSTTAIASISDTDASGNGWGVIVGSGFGTARATVTRSTLSNNTNIGLFVDGSTGTATAAISGSLLSSNGTGYFNNGGTLEVQGNNTVRYNGLDSNGTITTFSGF